ncbi:MAG: hypothetical protein ABI685_08840 [Ferruginibacter sp.]
MNKYKVWGIIGGAATFFTIFGIWAKLTHQAYADTTLTIGMWALSISAAILIYLIFTSLQKNK